MGLLAGYSWHSKYTVIAPATQDIDNYVAEIDLTWITDMRGDFGDVRFTKEDGTTLLYYNLYSYTASTSAIFHVNVGNVTAGQNVFIWIYAGNPGATNASDPDNVYVFYDGFDDQSVDASKWDTSGDITEEADGHLLLHHTEGAAEHYCKSDDTWSAPMEIIAKIWCGSENTYRWSAFGFEDASGNYIHVRGDQTVIFKFNIYNQYHVHDDDHDDYETKTYYEMRIEWWDDMVKFYIDGSLVSTCSDADVPDGPLNIYFGGDDYTYQREFRERVDYVMLLPLSGDPDDLPGGEQGDWLPIRVWRTHRFAYEETPSTWGTPVAPGEYDEVKLISLRPLIDESEMIPDPSAGYAWIMNMKRGRRFVNPNIVIPFRWSGRFWSMITHLMGTDSITGSGPYIHTITQVDSIDGSDLFGTLTAILGLNTAQFLFEWPSLKIHRIIIEGPDNVGYMRMTVRTIGDDFHIGTDCTTVVSDMESVTHIQLDSALPSIVPFQNVRFRINDESRDALDSDDIVPIKKLRIEFGRPLQRTWKSRAGYTHEWETSEPIENGLSRHLVEVTFGDIANLTNLENVQDGTFKKADLFWSYSGDHDIKFEFPSLVPEIPEVIGARGRIPQHLRFRPKEAASNPSGMAFNRWQITMRDDYSSAYN